MSSIRKMLVCCFAATAMVTTLVVRADDGLGIPVNLAVCKTKITNGSNDGCENGGAICKVGNKQGTCTVNTNDICFCKVDG